MLTQEKQKCLTSNCTKITTHESGICHLHRKRRVNAKGEIEWCFPTNCYFKIDNERAKAEFCLLPKGRNKQKSEPIKSFANLDKLLKIEPKHEEPTFNENYLQHPAQQQIVEPPVHKHEEVGFSDTENKYKKGFWKWMSSLVIRQAKPIRSQ